MRQAREGIRRCRRGSQVLASYSSQLLALYSSGGFVEVFVDARGVS
jgi:hypothetical protein